MKCSHFLLITGILSMAFGAMMFLLPAFTATTLGMAGSDETESVLRGMGGLIIGSGLLNVLARNFTEYQMLRTVLLTNIVTHILGLSVDLLGVFDGLLAITKMAPVEITHLFVGIGSAICLLRMKDPGRWNEISNAEKLSIEKGLSDADSGS